MMTSEKQLELLAALNKIGKELELMRKLIEGVDPIEVGRLAQAFLRTFINKEIR